jgi:hypothetical protein
VDEAEFQRWWEMHLRIARGQLLSPDEKAVYEAGREDLERDEKLQEVRSTREAREQLQKLEAERGQLEKRRQQLDREIAALEGRLNQETRQLLGVEE